MNFTKLEISRSAEITKLFENTFSASEGAEEGQVIGNLTRQIMAKTASEDLYVFGATSGADIAGSIMFTRLIYPNSDQAVFVMGPVSVASKVQGQGIGQKLIAFGLAELQAASVDVVVTYGDPSYYTKSGFNVITEDQIAAPYKLQFPKGWLAQSLNDKPLPNLAEPCRCVAAFADPKFW